MIDSQMEVRLSALRAGSPLPPSRFLAFISVTGRVDPKAILLLEGLDILKISNDLIGNRTHDLSACRTVIHPTVLSFVELNTVRKYKNTATSQNIGYINDVQISIKHS
jgi:hypothetical protein